MKRIVLYTFISLGFVSCKKKSELAPTPAIAVLQSPVKNESCNTGKILSATESSVTFNWSLTKNAESYELSIKNLLTNDLTSVTTDVNLASVTLKRNTPYSWFVTAKSSKTTSTSKSEVWKFYNSGLSATSYAPFPAEIITPKMNDVAAVANNRTTLTWAGLDVDNDIAAYDIYFGNNSTPPLFQANVAANITSLSVTVNPNTYYWKVVTKDSKGNTSDSGVFMFVVN